MTIETTMMSWLLSIIKVAGVVWIIACIVLGTAWGIGAFWRGVKHSLDELAADDKPKAPAHER